MPVVRARVSRCCLGRRSEVDDLAQEVWLALLADGGGKLRAYDPDRGATLEGFVGVVAEREARQRLRMGMAKKRGGGAAHVSVTPGETATTPALADHRPNPEEQLTSQDLAERLGAYLEAKLPLRGQLVLRYVFTDGVSPPDAARAIGVNVQVIYNWQHKIRALSREFLTEARA